MSASRPTTNLGILQLVGSAAKILAEPIDQRVSFIADQWRHSDQRGNYSQEFSAAAARRVEILAVTLRTDGS